MVVKIMVILFSVLFSSILLLFGIVLAYSPGKLAPFLDKEGKLLKDSISKKVFIEIGGVRQGMFIRGKNIKNPILLYVHGGPSFPEYFLVDKYPTGLEDAFTVCYWEERGGGLSYSSDVSIESMTMEQLISDTIEVTNYLRQSFGQEKIYLMAHSGGTAFAIQVAAKEPKLYSAYIGIAQITRQVESEKLAYKYLVEHYDTVGNKKMMEKLEEYPVLEDDSFVIPFFKSIVRDQAMHDLGIGTMRNMKSLAMNVVVPIMLCEAYSLADKINIWTSKFTFIKETTLNDQLLSTDLTIKVPGLDIPVYFFSGAYDLTVNHDLSKDYLKQIQAPTKGFYIFENSAHSPIYEEPAKMMMIIKKDVLAGKCNLADKY